VHAAVRLRLAAPPFAIQAEALGFADIWVSEHIILPRAQFPPKLRFYEPVPTLSWVAARETRHLCPGAADPMPLAKELATLRNLSDGRPILGAEVGRLAREFASPDASSHERGHRMNRASRDRPPLSPAAGFLRSSLGNRSGIRECLRRRSRRHRNVGQWDQV
jgi:alkanesulfonate monooxygenase SsuD/methylene tetrahydromethanopterin reductase-like flavin-dependent oxidoreductase (luciferase family)